MYIEPNTKIYTLSNVPLDTTYDHTIYFEDKESQFNYFNGLVKHRFDKQYYQRVNRGEVRLQMSADHLYDCNYLMFQNTAYGNKWFYAFVTAVEYVNDNMTKVSYEIDDMQTWFFDYEPEYCFVEREHSVTDAIGEHIEPENVDCGEYVFNGYGKLLQSLDDLCVIMVINDNAEQVHGGLYDGVYGGSLLVAFKATDHESITSRINDYNQKPDAIVSMYMCPSIAVGQNIPDGGVDLTSRPESTDIPLNGVAITEDDRLDGYKPKNNKLYTYPYNYFTISNGSGNSMNFRYEFFTGLTPTFKLNCSVVQPVQCLLKATNYKNSGATDYMFETLMLSNYPMCSWLTDAYKAWLAQNSLPLIAENLGSSVASGGNIAAGIGLAGLANPATAIGVGVAGAGLSLISSVLSQGYRASIAADISKGSMNCGSVNVSSKLQNFFGGRCSITAQYAKMIDDYFNMFGYAVRKCKVPNRNSRPHWNFVKTVGCTLVGSVPADVMNKLCSIYDKGVTFWKNGNEVGDYSLDNSV